MSEDRTYRRYRVKAPMQFVAEDCKLGSTPKLDYTVRVDTCGLCRSDLHFATSWAQDWDDLGHEFGGTIVAVRGPNARFEIGDRVAVRNAAACLACPACLAGSFRSCTGLVVNKQGFSQYADCDERSLVSAGSLDDDRLALVEPTNVALDLIHSASIEPGERVAVLGTGTLGLLTSFLLTRYRGITDVLTVGRQQAPPLIQTLELEPYLSLDDTSRAGSLDESIGGRPDCVLVTTPPSTLGDALALAAPGGRILTVGLDKNEQLEAAIDVRTLIFKRARVEGVFAVPNLYFEEAVAALEEVGGPLKALISRTIAFDDLPSAFAEWDVREHFDGKARVELHACNPEAVEAREGACSL
jgi:(R,R)-butanediol dehydrogenase/meso-butanediol dehydrogenase/diacetyl reductase